MKTLIQKLITTNAQYTKKNHKHDFFDTKISGKLCLQKNECLDRLTQMYSINTLNIILEYDTD